MDINDTNKKVILPTNASPIQVAIKLRQPDSKNPGQYIVSDWSNISNYYPPTIKAVPIPVPGIPVPIKSTPVPPAGFEEPVITSYTPYKNPFPDTNISDLSGMAAAELYRRAVLGGYPDGQFKGYRNVNRAELAKFLLLARYGLISDYKNNNRFADVLEGQWYVKYVVRAANLGIIAGYPDGLFRPDKTVNTAEFLKMITLTFGLPENLAYSYKDVPSGDWYARYAGVAFRYNLFPNRTNYLKPASELTRTEVAIAIYQYLKYRNEPVFMAKQPVKMIEGTEGPIYVSNKYKFEILFPQSWDGYLATEKKAPYGEIGDVRTIFFGFSAQDDLFAISIFTKAQWQAINKEEGPKPAYLAENDLYVFGFSQAQYTANDEMAARYAEIPNIQGMFRLIED